jgi:H(+)-translocating pyrophosphatase
VSDDGEIDTSVNKKVVEISDAIARGAKAFLMAEYKYLAVFLVLFGIFTMVAVGSTIKADDADPLKAEFKNWAAGALSGVAFLVGGGTSIVSGYIGMTIAVQANSRTALQAQRGYVPAFRTAFRAGAVLGFALCGLALLMLFILIQLFKLQFPFPALIDGKLDPTPAYSVRYLFETIASYGFGGSAVALFGRVGGGIYTKAADVGADLVGKVEQGIPEDDPRNPAVIADNVGDNVGDVAGMGADLFGSFAEASCAALVIASDSTSGVLVNNWNSILLPLVISASGIIACLFTSFLASHINSVTRAQDIEPALKRQLFVSTVLETPLLVLICLGFLPAEFCIGSKVVKNWGASICCVSGLWAGLAIGYITEYYTSHSYRPVREVAGACKTGAATNIIYGLALGYNSAIIPVLAIAGSIFVSYELASLYGIALAALGILSTLSIGLTIDVYGPVSDNAGGIAEMAGIGEHVRERTDALDAAGNTTAAIGKGFAIGSAAFVSLALFGAYVTRVKAAVAYDPTRPVFTVDILQPFQFCGLLIGAMLPYAFSALTMKSVGKAALAMVEEVRRQFLEIPGIMEGTGQPDYERCVKISTESSLREMILPGVLVLGSPIVVGFIMGPAALAGLLAGSLVSGVQMAISSSNTGGAWDNAKKYIEGGAHGGKGSEPHKAAVVGDTVGDPLVRPSFFIYCFVLHLHI